MGRPPLLIVTGAAAVGKTTISNAIAAQIPEIAAIDGDVIAAGAASVHGERRDYDAFWGYMVSIAEQLVANGLIPLYGCLMRPEQLLANDLSSFSRIEMLALVCDSEVRMARAEARDSPGLTMIRTAREEHDWIDDQLRERVLPTPHQLTVLDVTNGSAAETTRRGLEWARAAIGLS